MEKKQSSIDWFVEQMIKEISKKFTVTLTPIGLELIKQARAMHKQEYIDAWMNGQNDSGYSQKELRQMAEEDYNETYGN